MGLIGLKGQTPFRQNAMDIFYEFVSPKLVGKSKRDQIRMKRRKKNTDLDFDHDANLQQNQRDKPDIVLMNAALNCFAEFRDLSLSKHIISMMERHGVRPDA